MKFKEPLEIHFRDIEHLNYLIIKFCYFQKTSRINKKKNVIFLKKKPCKLLSRRSFCFWVGGVLWKFSARAWVPLKTRENKCHWIDRLDKIKLKEEKALSVNKHPQSGVCSIISGSRIEYCIRCVAAVARLTCRHQNKFFTKRRLEILGLLTFSPRFGYFFLSFRYIASSRRYRMWCDDIPGRLRHGRSGNVAEFRVRSVVTKVWKWTESF